MAIAYLRCCMQAASWIADVVTSALTEPRHAGQLYELTGPRLLSFADAVAEISRESGRPLRYRAVTPAEYSALLAPFLPEEEVAFLVQLFEQLLDGHNAWLTDGVERALGQKPRDFTQFAREGANAGAWSDAAASPSPG